MKRGKKGQCDPKKEQYQKGGRLYRWEREGFFHIPLKKKKKKKKEGKQNQENAHRRQLNNPKKEEMGENAS